MSWMDLQPVPKFLTTNSKKQFRDFAHKLIEMKIYTKAI